MERPFTQDVVFAVFGQYNSVIWPLILLFYVLGTACVVLLFRPSRFATLVIPLTLVAMWLVNGIGYQRLR